MKISINRMCKNENIKSKSDKELDNVFCYHFFFVLFFCFVLYSQNV